MQRLADALPVERAATRWIVSDDPDEHVAGSATTSTWGFTTWSSTRPGPIRPGSWSCTAPKCCPGCESRCRSRTRRGRRASQRGGTGRAPIGFPSRAAHARSPRRALPSGPERRANNGQEPAGRETKGYPVAVIEQVGAREILDSRGNPTVEVEVALDDGTLARAAVPSGASTGEHEAVELRDGDPAALSAARASRRPSAAVLDEIGPELIGMEAVDQRVIDQRLVDLDGTPDKCRLGANALLGRVAGGGEGGGGVVRAGAVPLRRRPERARAAGADDEHHQRRRARRQRRRRAGVHDRPDRAPTVQGGAALGRGGLPRAQVAC